MPDAAVPDAWGKVTDFFFSLAALGKGTFFFASILLLSFYFMLHGERTLRGLLLLAPAGKREGLRQLARDMSQVLGAYVRGLLVTAAVVGLLSSATYWLIGLPHAAVLGVFMGIAQLLPLLGPLVGMVPPTIIALSLDSMPGTASGLAEPLVSWPMTVLWVTLATLVIEQGKNSFLAPHFISKAVGVHPMVTLLAIVAFGSLLGIGGAILAIPLASVLQLLISRYVLRPHDFSNLANPDAKRRGELGVILYRADALVHDVRKHGRNATGMELPATDEHGIEDALEAVTVDLQRMLQETAAREDLP
jgi:predicted PurR-regulated permease PerM